MEQDHLEILREDIRGKFGLVLEGHETQRQQIEMAEQSSEKHDEHLLFLIETENTKIDGVAGDLADQRRAQGASVAELLGRGGSDRRDTEAHGAVCGVKEG